VWGGRLYPLKSEQSQESSRPGWPDKPGYGHREGTREKSAKSCSSFSPASCQPAKLRAVRRRGQGKWTDPRCCLPASNPPTHVAHISTGSRLSPLFHLPLIAGRRKSHVCLMHASAALPVSPRLGLPRPGYHMVPSLLPHSCRDRPFSPSQPGHPTLIAEGLIRHATSIPRNTLGDHNDKRKLDNETLESTHSYLVGICTDTQRRLRGRR
jgi:hypothetical protein